MNSASSKITNLQTMRRRDPNKTQAQILQAATEEFSEKGLEGARIDAIAFSSQTNKRMIYHYFGSKDGLYAAVLENIYRDIDDAERELHFDAKNPELAITQLIEFKFKYFLKNAHFIRIINTENLRTAKDLKQSDVIRKAHEVIILKIADILKNGEKLNLFRSGIDATELYISITSLSYFYLTNAASFGTIFQKDLLSNEAMKNRLEHTKNLILTYLKI